MTKIESSFFPPISDLVDPLWVPNKQRLLVASVDETLRMSNALGGKTPVEFPPATLARFGEGLVLDVGCGLNFGLGCTLVDLLPNAYGLDPGLISPESHPRIGNPPRDRTIGGFAEDMPFRDRIFRWTLSLKCVGWYPNVTVNPYWAINEMIRVTEDAGLIMILIGQNDKNGQFILDAAQEAKAGALGSRIAVIKDFTNAPAPQVTIRLS